MAVSHVGPEIPAADAANIRATRLQGPKAEGMVEVTEEAAIDPKARGTAAAQAKTATAVRHTLTEIRPTQGL